MTFTPPPWLWSKVSECSVDAIKVLAALDAKNAYSPNAAVTDAQLARATGLPQRSIIDLTGALLSAGLVIIASTRPPHGRYIVLPGDAAGIAAARRYQEDLDSRARAIHVRAKATREAIALYDQHARPADSTGQLALGLSAAADKPRWRDN